jgi:5-(carboxyamino)imidazole ribonucleotide mutase
MSDIRVGIIMGSQSDWPTMKEASTILDELGVPYETRIVSAHRTPDRLWSMARRRQSAACMSSSPAPAARHTCPA